MIADSYAWKNELLSDAEILERWAAKKSISTRRSILIERKIFLTAYAIRKLYEAEKLSSTFEDRIMACQTFQSISDRITKENTHKLDELYDFDNPNQKTVLARQIMDIIIHSLAFFECLDEDLSIPAFLVTSDRKRNCLFLIGLDRFISLMRDVGQDYPSHAIKMFDPELNDWVVWQGHGNPPKHVLDKFNTVRSKQITYAKKGWPL